LVIAPVLHGLTNEEPVDTSAYSPNESQVTVGVINRRMSAMVKGGTPSPGSDYTGTHLREQP